MSNTRGAQLRSYLELIRPPALFTAAADSLTGWVWAGAVIVTPDHLNAWYVPVLLILISGSVYAAGMCTNDLFDLEEDRRDRPQRPLPSARRDPDPIRSGPVRSLPAARRSPSPPRLPPPRASRAPRAHLPAWRAQSGRARARAKRECARIFRAVSRSGVPPRV